MSTSDNCKDGASKSKSDDVCEVNNNLHNMSLNNIDVVVSVCANCGKEGANNICNKCKQVRYCNAVCKKVHKKKHKKDCEEHQRLAAECAAKLHDEKLFKQPPQSEDCPICFLRLPLLDSGSQYMSCCGKTICSGCSYAPVYDNQGNEVDNEKQNECAFCRAVAPKLEETVKMIMKRVEANDPIAIFNLGFYYRNGTYGFPQDYEKALEHWHRAAELGSAEAYTNIGYAFIHGEGVEVDKKKAVHYWELAAIGGVVTARFNLGAHEENAGNMDRALKHYMISAKSGHSKSLGFIKDLYLDGHATKEDYTKALQLYQTYLAEIKSDQRDQAAAAKEENRYY